MSKGFSHKKGIDYTETLSLVSTKDFFRIIMTIVAHYDLELHQMDVNNSFLNGDLFENVYMVQPIGFQQMGNGNFVCKLKKLIYGLKKALRQWHIKFDEVIIINGFKENVINMCKYMKVSGSSFIFLVLYVDDILFATNDTNLLVETKQMLCNHFDMKDLGETSFVFGIKVV